MTSSDPSDNLQQLRFEDALAQLEHLVEQIESGQLGLEDALKQYERGTALIKRCRVVLAAAEQRIAELTKGPEGELQVQGDSGDDADVSPMTGEEQ